MELTHKTLSFLVFSGYKIGALSKNGSIFISQTQSEATVIPHWLHEGDLLIVFLIYRGCCWKMNNI